MLACKEKGFDLNVEFKQGPGFEEETEAKKKVGGDVDDDGIVKSPLLVAYVRPKPSFSSWISSEVRSGHSLLKDKSSTAHVLRPGILKEKRKADIKLFF